MIIYIFLIFSVLLNVFCAWYIWNILQRLLFVSENIDDMKISLNYFRQHLETLYELELFYGDETFKSFVEHAKDICDDINKFEEIFSLVAPEEEGLDGDEQPEQPEEKTQRQKS